LSIYTSYDMIGDCRAGKPAGVVHFVRHFLAGCRSLTLHYGGGEEEVSTLLGRAPKALAAMEPGPERRIMVDLRPLIQECAGYGKGVKPTGLDLVTLSKALEEFSVLERQMVWLSSMGYDAAGIARILRVSAETAGKACVRAAELVRPHLSNWTQTILRDAGPELGEEARGAKPEEPVSFREYIEIVDGRLTWANRVPVERGLAQSWHEIDHLCRVREADDALRSVQPLNEQETAAYLEAAGIKLEKPSLWRRLFASG